MYLFLIKLQLELPRYASIYFVTYFYDTVFLRMQRKVLTYDQGNMLTASGSLSVEQRKGPQRRKLPRLVEEKVQREDDYCFQ